MKKFEDLNLAMPDDLDYLNKLASEYIGEPCTYRDVHFMHYLKEELTADLKRDIGIRVLYRFTRTKYLPDFHFNAHLEDQELAAFMEKKELQQALNNELTNNNKKEKKVKI